MTHDDHVRLIRKAFNGKGGRWADFGSGDGAFTLALRDIAGPEVEIYSVDKNLSRLQNQKKMFEELFPGSDIRFIHADFRMHIALPYLDGIIMANSIHYVKNKMGLLTSFKPYLKKSGKMIIVEYNVDEGNRWVPFPLSYQSFKNLAIQTGFTQPILMHTIPSYFLKEIYSAVTEMESV